MVYSCFHSYLSDSVGYLLHYLKREKERPAAFRAMGQIVYVLKDRMDLEPVLTNKEQPPHWERGGWKVSWV